MTFRNVRRTQPLLAIISDKKFDRHRLEHAQVIHTPAPDTDEKNPFHLLLNANYGLYAVSNVILSEAKNL